MTQKSLEKGQLGLSEVISELIESTFGQSHKNSYHQEVQNRINEQLLESLYNLVADEQTYKGVRAVAASQLEGLANRLERSEAGEDQKAVDRFLAKEIREVLKNPQKRKPRTAPKIPDGSPIGTDMGQ